MKTGDKELALLEGLHAEGHTIVMVTHREKNALRAGWTIEIRDGEIVTETGMHDPRQDSR